MAGLWKTKAELCKLGLDFLRMAIRLKLMLSAPFILPSLLTKPTRGARVETALSSAPTRSAFYRRPATRAWPADGVRLNPPRLAAASLPRLASVAREVSLRCASLPPRETPPSRRVEEAGRAPRSPRLRQRYARTWLGLPDRRGSCAHVLSAPRVLTWEWGRWVKEGPAVPPPT